ncbi:class I adenylate-forming enzyme family protein [Nocardiopsis sp. NPDC006198]|uniref:class I adenylate-forming enzyme family protein n=1 Tax=Nocardiopsis sp. NPDC006198 TaxID=3154472 RepID=UPI00339EE3DB
MIGPLHLVGSAPALTPTLPRLGRAPVAVGGHDQQLTALATVELLRARTPVLLTPTPHTHPATRGLLWDGRWNAAPSPAPPAPGWDVAFYTSGSTGTPRLYAFTLDQLTTVVNWYAAIYRLTADSVVITSMPATYNFTAVAGVLAAAMTGASLHLGADSSVVLDHARTLAARHDRCVVLANPVVLQHARPGRRLPSNVLIDSGGAPLSATAITRFRETVADLREGYGLTETASLTHFDAEGTPDSLGTVGGPLPECAATTAPSSAAPVVSVSGPAVGRQLTADGALGPTQTRLVTTDLGRVDSAGRLRLLGRSDDLAVGGLWPREVLDAIGPVLGTRCALVRHPAPDRITVRLLDAENPLSVDRLRRRVGVLTGLPAHAVQVDVEQPRSLLHSHKLLRHTTAHPPGSTTT